MSNNEESTRIIWRFQFFSLLL